MPQKKKSQEFFGIHRPLAFHPEIRKFFAKRQGVIRQIKDFLLLVHAAESESFFTLPRTRSRLARVEAFSELYARDTDGVLEFMCLVRKILLKWRKTQAGRVIEYLYSHRTIFSQTSKQEFVKNRCVAVIVNDELKHTEKRIPVSDLSPSQLQELLYPRLVAVDTLQDKELAHLLNVYRGLNVNTESVKKARQFIAKIDEKIAFLENADVGHYLQTGVITPSLRRFVQSNRKGKKQPFSFPFQREKPWSSLPFEIFDMSLITDEDSRG